VRCDVGDCSPPARIGPGDGCVRTQKADHNRRGAGADACRRSSFVLLQCGNSRLAGTRMPV
jgi:hypothetical protein